MKKKELQSIDYIKQRADENLAKTKSVFLYRRELAIRFALREKKFYTKETCKKSQNDGKLCFKTNYRRKIQQGF